MHDQIKIHLTHFHIIDLKKTALISFLIFVHTSTQFPVRSYFIHTYTYTNILPSYNMYIIQSYNKEYNRASLVSLSICSFWAHTISTNNECSQL